MPDHNLTVTDAIAVRDRGPAPIRSRSLRRGLVAWAVAGSLLIGGAAIAAPSGPGPAGRGQGAGSSPTGNTERGRGLDHDGDADRLTSTTYTEDNDTNDGVPNNVADSGDNMHPSGKDGSVENGNSGNQGNAESHPDDSKGPMRYEGELGPDKPNGPGGTDLADQDGNNGCGNDDDFDDDNNGWCGRKRPRPVTPTPTPTPTQTPVHIPGGSHGGGSSGGGSSGGGSSGVRPSLPLPSAPVQVAAAAATNTAPASQPAGEVRVLGVTIHRAQGGPGPGLEAPGSLTPVMPQVLGTGSLRPDQLARTGIEAGDLLLTALALMGFGWAISQRRMDLGREERDGLVIRYNS